jgi:hypothetical protein
MQIWVRLCSYSFGHICVRICSHRLFPACWQVVNGLLTTCYKIVELDRLVTSCSLQLFIVRQFNYICQQVVSDNLVATWWNNSIVTTCWQACYKVVELNRLVTSCSNNLLSSCNSTICQQVVSDNLVATWWNNNLVTTLSQARYKPVANTSCWQLIFTCVKLEQLRFEEESRRTAGKNQPRFIFRWDFEHTKVTQRKQMPQ